MTKKDYLKILTLRKYRMSLNDFWDLKQEQENKCAICGDCFYFMETKGVHMDHDHNTGTARGILCQNCNVGLGHFKDNVANLYKAIQYLIKHKKKNAEAA